MTSLEVFFFDELVGHLKQDDDQLSFVYSENYLTQSNASAISLSLPLKSEDYTGNKVEAFFGGFLPEADIRKLLAAKLGISEENDFAMLNQIGGDCAGAVSIGSSKIQSKRKPLNDKDLAKFFKQIPSSPLLSFQETRRMSLAGAQHKLAVLVEDEQIYLPSDKEISTHIVKPIIKEYPDSSHNEYFCMELARRIGLRVPKIKLCLAETNPYLLITRYDRDEQTRLHQEDFCQALGISYKTKYQDEGGPGFKECFNLVVEHCNDAGKDKLRLLDLVIFNFLIGNNDAHSKNFSLLYRDKTRYIELAPCYDLLSTAIYPDLSNKMAMKIGKEHNYRKVRPSDWQRLAEEIEVNPKFLSKRSNKLAQDSLAQAQELAQDLNSKYSSNVYTKIINYIKERMKYIY